MFSNSSHFQICKVFSKSICNSVCAFLNTDGGRVLFVNNGKYFAKEKDAIKFKNNLENLLEANISDYPKYKIKYGISEINNNYFVGLDVEKSSSPHFVIEDKEKKYYIRSGSQNKKINYGLKFDIRPISVFQDNYNKIGDFATGGKFYKYMSLEIALQCLRGQNIWFVEPSKWQDKYENYFYKAEILGYDISENNPLVYTTCVTNRKESESAWKIYAYNSQGLASRCVEFIINRKKFRDSLVDCKYRMDSKEKYDRNLKDEFDIYEGVVVYKDEQIITNLPKETIKRNTVDIDNDYYHAYFDDFSFQNYLNLLLLKRVAFEHEHETRIFIVNKSFDPNSKKGEDHLDLQLDWREFIEGVRFDANCSAFERKLLEEELKRALGLSITGSFPDGFTFKEYNVYSGPTPAIVK